MNMIWKPTANGVLEITSKGGPVEFITVTGHADLGGGAIAVTVTIDDVDEATTLDLSTAGIANKASIDLGPGVHYKLTLSGSTNPDFWVSIIGATVKK